ncbi:MULTISPECIES: alpha/beta fold hydrolase [Streptomyces]|uniref:alpha/beta fold hydrolase n=1 Tax=Streptomyces TaxID=1883 RepID=UPI000304C63B|nr:MULTISPECIES: alpha/beta fold hydrolase [Streptomyces]WSI78216.1 alpha/beta fold hydrolase [Streptomyces anulatus]WSU74214.1 alpha/beta fold hydrolase [Streptomyces anulatus]WTD10475.1 alpha/beta fold hydrolase [Streptomyces anulatus]WTD27432.1 alpha/beta fold hydrolase [Streptomyces anulatus]WTE03780.1 alpha/beta fold hydrolase [Streptomyces anulatus]
MNVLKRLPRAIFSPIPISRTRAIGISERLAALSSLSSSLEYLHQHRNLKPGGLNDWDIMRQTPESKMPAIQKLTDLVSGRRTTMALHASRVACSLAMLAPGNSRWRAAGDLYLGLTTTVLQARHRYGTDGSDQVATQVQAVTGLARLSRSPGVQDALMWYLAIQASMSYSLSGLAKLAGTKWRDGSALPGVLRTRTYGFERAYRLTQRYPRASKVTQHAVLAMECLFPVVYLAGGRMTRPMIGAAGSFHVVNAFVMGLGRFMTAFPAMHPMVAYTSAPKTFPVVAGRDDRMVKTALVFLAAGVTVAGVAATQRRAHALAGWPNSRTVTTRYGNTLSYDVGGQDMADRPVLVFNHGLASTTEHFAWMIERLAFDIGQPVLSYARAGYGPSRRLRDAPYSVQESVDDLEDLIRGALPDDRQVVLVGHSLGAELNRRVAQRLGDRVAGVVYLDPTHPAQLIRSDRQRRGSELFTTSLDELARWTRLGTGALMTRPNWVDHLPSSYRDKAFALYTDARLWQAASREWKAVRAELEAYEGDLTPVRAPGLVVAAQVTVDMDPDQLLMYHDLVRSHQAAGSHGDVAVVEQGGHDTILTDARHARTVADLIMGFVEEHCTPPAEASGEPAGSVPEKVEESK